MTKPRLSEDSVPKGAKKGAEDATPRKDGKLWESDMSTPVKPLSPSGGSVPNYASSHRVHPLTSGARSPVLPPRFSAAALRSASHSGLPPYSAVDQSPRPGVGVRSPTFHAASLRSSSGKWPPDPSASVESARSETADPERANSDLSQVRRRLTSQPNSARNSPQRRGGALNVVRRSDNLHLFDNMATFAGQARKSPGPEAAALQSPRGALGFRQLSARSPLHSPVSPPPRSPQPRDGTAGKAASLQSPRAKDPRASASRNLRSPCSPIPRSPKASDTFSREGTGTGDLLTSPSHSLSREALEGSWSRETPQRRGSLLSPTAGLPGRAIALPARLPARDDPARPLTSPRPGQSRSGTGALPPNRLALSVVTRALSDTGSECEDTGSVCSSTSPSSTARSAASSPGAAPPPLAFIPAVVAPAQPDAPRPAADIGASPKLSLAPTAQPTIPRIETVPPSPESGVSASAGAAAVQECVICMETPRDCLLMPCRHLVVCYSCGQLTEACPVCRAAVEVKIQVFHP
eukprot:EG_transcript_5665